jgi:hypothetical protein
MNEENNPELEYEAATTDSKLVYEAVPSPGTKICGIVLIWTSIFFVVISLITLNSADSKTDIALAYVTLYTSVSLEFLGWILYLVGCVIHTIRREATATRMSLIFPYKTLHISPYTIADKKAKELLKKLTLCSKF